MRKFILAAAVTLMASSVSSQEHCDVRSIIVAALEANYGETQQSLGINSDGDLVEVFASLESGSWSILVTQPLGPTCFVAIGQAFQLSPAAIKGEKL